MERNSSIAKHLRTIGAAAALAAMAAGCQSLTQSVTEPLDRRPVVAAPPPEAPSDRPMVKVTAADLYSWGPGAAAQELEFYDELERRDLVAHDDLLHAALLFINRSSGATYQQRLELAKAQGWIDRDFRRPGREAVTVGEAARVLARAMGTPGTQSPESAVATFRNLGLLPDVAEPGQGLSGPQMLALLTNSHDYRESGQVGRPAITQRPQDPPVALVDTPAPAAASAATAPQESFEQFDPPTPPAAPSPAAPVAAAPAAQPSDTSRAPQPMKEPLPQMPRAEGEDGPKPAPAPAAEEPAKPRPTPRPWVGGKPLKKGGAGK